MKKERRERRKGQVNRGMCADWMDDFGTSLFAL